MITQDERRLSARPRSSSESALAPYVPAPVLAGAARFGRAAPWSQTLDGSLLVADLAGFTRLADRVAERGRLGAEQLVAILNRYYGCILAPVFKRGGQPFRFGGDSLVAFFAGDGHAQAAAACATEIHAALARVAALPASAGGGRLRVSAGVASGQTLLVSAGDGAQAGFLLLGEPVARAVQAQDLAEAGQTLLAADLAASLGLSCGDDPAAYVALDGTVDAPPRPPAPRPRSDAERYAASFLNPVIADRLRAEGGARYGEHRRVAALFVQIDGMHGLSAAGTAGIDLVTTVAAAIARDVVEGGGVLLGADPTPVGAKFLAVFGLDRAGEHDAEQAALTALTLARSLRGLPDTLVWRIGMNAGTVFASDLGVRRRRDYTVLGDPINVAARLAAGAAPGQAVAHAALETELRPAVRLGSLPAAAAKGKSGLLPRVQLLERRRAPLSPVAPPVTALAGREQELNRLRALADVAIGQRTTRSALISGPAGVGKSALIGTLAREWEERGGRSLVLTVRRLDTTGEPYAAWRGPLRALLRLRGRDHTTTLPAIATAVALWSIEEADAAALVARLIGVAVPNDPLAGIEPALLRERLRRTVVALLGAAAHDRPLLIVADGADAMDEASLDLLAAMIDGEPAGPLLAVAGARAARPAGRWSDEIALAGLDDAALELVVSGAIGAARLDPRVTAFLQARTGGNPLFAIELAREAIGAGTIAVLPGTNTCAPLADLAALPAPASLGGLLLAAVDALDPLDRRLVQAAAVCGQQFHATLLLGAEPALSEQALDRALARLVAHDILQRAADGSLLFRRPLLREAVYEALPSIRRRRMHRRIAEALLTAHANDEEALAAHLIAAGDARLVPYALRAGARARDLADGESALRAYRAITHGSRRTRRAQPPSTLAALVAEGDVCVHLVSRYAEALQSYGRALRLAERIGGEGDLGPGAIAYRIGYAKRRLGENDTALRWLRRAARDGSGTPATLRAEALLEAASTLYLRGRTARALELCARALTAARAAGDRAEVARCLDNRGTVLSAVGRLDEAIDDLAASVETSAALGNRAAEAKAQTNLGAAYFWQARWGEAADAYRRALELRRRLGDRDRTAQAALNLGEVYAMRGDFDAALGLFAECRAIWERSGYAIGIAHARLFAGQALARAGRPDEAAEELGAALRGFLDLRHTGIAVQAGAAMAEALAQAGRLDEARAAATQVEALSQSVESEMYRAMAQRAMAVAGGQSNEERIALLGAAAESFAALGMGWERAATVEHLAAALAASRPARAISFAEQARAAYAALGTTPDERRAEALVARLRAQAGLK